MVIVTGFGSTWTQTGSFWWLQSKISHHMKWLSEFVYTANIFLRKFKEQLSVKIYHVSFFSKEKMALQIASVFHDSRCSALLLSFFFFNNLRLFININNREMFVCLSSIVSQMVRCKATMFVCILIEPRRKFLQKISGFSQRQLVSQQEVVSNNE